MILRFESLNFEWTRFHWNLVKTRMNRDSLLMAMILIATQKWKQLTLESRIKRLYPRFALIVRIKTSISGTIKKYDCCHAVIRFPSRIGVMASKRCIIKHITPWRLKMLNSSVKMTEHHFLLHVQDRCIWIVRNWDILITRRLYIGQSH